MSQGKIHFVTFLFLIVGGILWGVEGLFQWNISGLFTGQIGWLDRATYALAGVSALYELATHKANCKACEQMMKKSSAAPSPS